MFMGQFDLAEFLQNAPVFGVIFFFTYMIVIVMIEINLFVGMYTLLKLLLFDQSSDFVQGKSY